MLYVTIRFFLTHLIYIMFILFLIFLFLGPNVVFQLWKHPRDPLSKFDSSVEAGQAALIKYLLHNSFTSLQC